MRSDVLSVFESLMKPIYILLLPFHSLKETISSVVTANICSSRPGDKAKRELLIYDFEKRTKWADG